jgi:hypothetical protein
LDYLICKNHAKLNSYVNPDRSNKDIKLLNQLEEKNGHLKSPKRLCNCGVNYIKNITLFTQYFNSIQLVISDIVGVVDG